MGSRGPIICLPLTLPPPAGGSCSRAFVAPTTADSPEAARLVSRGLLEVERPDVTLPESRRTVVSVAPMLAAGGYR